MLITQITPKSKSVHAQTGKPSKPSEATREKSSSPKKTIKTTITVMVRTIAAGTIHGLPAQTTCLLLEVKLKHALLEQIGKSVFKHSSPKPLAVLLSPKQPFSQLLD